MAHANESGASVDGGATTLRGLLTEAVRDVRERIDVLFIVALSVACLQHCLEG